LTFAIKVSILKNVDLDDETLNLYEKAAEMTGLNSNCIMCVSLRELKVLEAATKLENR